MNDCIFCKIIKKEIPAKIVYESENVLAFPDVNPITPVHILIIPKEHIESIADISDCDQELMGELILVAKKIAEDMGIAEKGYKLLFRVKGNGGQEVPHIHLHLLGGAKLYEDIHPV
jgi:histidine triad (HIT) family protein